VKYRVLSFFAFLFPIAAGAARKDSATYHNLRDCVKASRFFAEINVEAGIKKVW